MQRKESILQYNTLQMEDADGILVTKICVVFLVDNRWGNKQMKCSNCGTEFTKGVFCPNCGTKFDEEAVKREEKEKRELELAKAKENQERLAKEKAEQEVELARLRNEQLRMEQEMEAKKQAEEEKKKEELTRTFNGILYATVDEMLAAKEKYEADEAEEKKVKTVNRWALICMVAGILSWPLLFTIILWIPAVIVSIVFGIKAIKAGTTKKGFVITGFIFAGVLIAIYIVGIVIGVIAS